MFNALRDALGSYAQACAPTVAINRKKGEHPADLARLCGVRPASAKAFGQKVEHKGFGAAKSNGLEYRTGLRLRPFSEEASTSLVPSNAIESLVGLA